MLISTKDENSNMCTIRFSELQNKTSEEPLTNENFEEKQCCILKTPLQLGNVKMDGKNCKWHSPPNRIFKPFLKV